MILISIIYLAKEYYDRSLEQFEYLNILGTSEGWKQISDVNAGWQGMVAGTMEGDALLHDLPIYLPGYGGHRAGDATT